MTADSELLVTETVCHPLEHEIKLIPRGYHINIQIPLEWWGIWGAAVFPNSGEADVTMWKGGCRGGRLGTVSWKTQFSVVDYGSPAKSIEAWAVSLKFRKLRRVSPRQSHQR